jgi:hypothetical protein
LQAKATVVDQQLVSDLQEGEVINNILRMGNRPTGSTIDASKTLDDLERKAFNDAATIYSKFKMTNKLPHGGLNQTMQRAKVQNGLENQENWIISAHSVRSQHCSNIKLSNGVVRHGPTSPLAPVEPLLLDELCIQRARMGQPILQSEGILLVNYIIQGTVYQTNLRQSR